MASQRWMNTRRAGMARRLGSTAVLVSLILPCSTAQGQQAARGAVGSKATEFVLDGIAGESVRFPERSTTNLPLTVVVFWATWNKPGLKDLESLKELWPQWSNLGVRVVAVNVEAHKLGDAERRTVGAYLRDNSLPFPVALDQGLSAFHAYGVIAVPTTIVIDSGGTIVLRLPGHSIGGAERLIRYVETGVIDSSKEARGEVSETTREHRRAIRYTRLARQLVVKGELQLAEYTLQQALIQGPDLLEVRLGLASLYETTDRIQNAVRVLEEARATFPEDSRLLIAHASLKLRAGDLEGADKLAARAFELNSSLSTALLVRARVRKASKDLVGALGLLRQAVALNPLDVDVMVEFGSVQESLGELSQAIEWYERAYSLLDPAWHQ